MTTPKYKSQEGPYARKGDYNIIAPNGDVTIFRGTFERDEILRMLNAAYAAGQATQWISVEERLPDVDEWVLAYSETGEVGDFPFDIGHIISGEWKCLGWDYPVTHWTPLPATPRGATDPSTTKP